ncbi:hypothetical protein RJ640_004038 [Escallonia rubra]|uniref:RNase H type-1 domain-containing protein n=1 Tax=Escallonia rubra TaxID=112253 RepID=A0AA88R266_9ASTE|nr:hypothetical protein RJ640_004038 [Escallonia rubra]
MLYTRLIVHFKWHQANFDGATRDGKSIQAVTIKDHNRVIIAAETQASPPVNAEMAEAMAALLDVNLAIRMKCSHVIFEGDAAMIIEWMSNTNSSPSWTNFAVVEETKDKLKSLGCWTFAKVSRFDNIWAHNLTRWADVSNFFGLVPPSSIASCLSMEE